MAGLRPNPQAQGQIENIAGSGAYRGLRSAETTVGVAIPIELGGKRSARVAVATAQLSRAELQAAIVAADVRVQVTQLYVEAIAAERRLVTARDQVRIASDALRAASVRVQAGRASPLEEQRANVAKVALLQRLAAVRGRLSLCADQAAAAKWWLSMPMASVSAEGPMPKALSTRRTSPLMPGCRHQGRACPLRRARMTSNPLIVA